mmetsp:Transcript_147835/g.256049  ORF Transcript_147835/g.256049 Transcript_147835/m.256049 type:complete len:90 (-) Transcript_147835:195-464(-)
MDGECKIRTSKFAAFHLQRAQTCPRRVHVFAPHMPPLYKTPAALDGSQVPSESGSVPDSCVLRHPQAYSEDATLRDRWCYGNSDAEIKG